MKKTTKSNTESAPVKKLLTPAGLRNVIDALTGHHKAYEAMTAKSLTLRQKMRRFVGPVTGLDAGFDDSIFQQVWNNEIAPELKKGRNDDAVRQMKKRARLHMKTKDAKKASRKARHGKTATLKSVTAKQIREKKAADAKAKAEAKAAIAASEPKAADPEVIKAFEKSYDDENLQMICEYAHIILDDAKLAGIDPLQALFSLAKFYRKGGKTLK